MAYLNKTEGSEVMPVALDPSTQLPYKLRVGQPVELTQDGVKPYTANVNPTVGMFVIVGNVVEKGNNTGVFFQNAQPQIFTPDSHVTVAIPSNIVLAAECDGTFDSGDLVGYDYAAYVYVAVGSAPGGHATGLILNGIPQGKAVTTNMYRVMVLRTPFKP